MKRRHNPTTKNMGLRDNKTSLRPIENPNLLRVDPNELIRILGQITRKEGIYGLEMPDGYVELYPIGDLLKTTEQDPDFANPARDEPISIPEFLKQLDLTPIMDVLSSYYCEEWRHRYPPEAMIRASIFKKLMKIRWYTQLSAYLQTHKEDAKNLGFDDKIPNYRTFRHFEIERLGEHGVEQVLDALVVEIRKELHKNGVKFGERVGADSTPLVAKRSDKDAAWNAHYGKYMYKMHAIVDVDTNIPIACYISSGEKHDGLYLPPLLLKARSLGIDFDYFYGDNHYASVESFATISTVFGAKARVNLRVDAVFNKNATYAKIVEAYQRLWKHKFYKIDADPSYMEYALVIAGEGKLVGAYHRNCFMREYEECPDCVLDDYHQRNKVEGLNGHLKQNALLEAYLDGRGIKYVEVHARMTLVAILAVALTRAQHGMTEGLTRLVGLS